jgi:hypothetical protein
MTELERRILEVATWILKVNPHFEHNYFRSEEIMPFQKWPAVQRQPISDFNLGVQKRRALLKEKNITLITLEEAATYGNLIYAVPDDSVLDGGAEFQSQGLVDTWEVPAWDTWVTFGAAEFKDFEGYPNAVISWIPKTVANLFFSGLSLAIIGNLGWVKLDLPDVFLSHLTIEPRNLEFIEITEQDKEAILSRLQLINGAGYDSPPTDTIKKTIADNSLDSASANNFLHRLKSWFS